jgi:hypothetical protein
MSDIQQMFVAMQRLVDFIFMVINSTLLHNNTGAVKTVERNCDFYWVCLSIINIVHCAGDARQTLKLQTRLPVREGAPHQQTRNCLKIIKERRGKIGRRSQMGA